MLWCKRQQKRLFWRHMLSYNTYVCLLICFDNNKHGKINSAIVGLWWDIYYGLQEIVFCIYGIE